MTFLKGIFLLFTETLITVPDLIREKYVQKYYANARGKSLLIFCRR